jgi:hypothetical protein
MPTPMKTLSMTRAVTKARARFSWYRFSRENRATAEPMFAMIRISSDSAPHSTRVS